MAPAAIQIVGGKEFRRELRRIGPELLVGLREAHKQTAELVSGEAKRRAPVLKTKVGSTSMRPGQLRDAIAPRGSQTRGSVVVNAGRMPHPSIPGIHEFGWLGHHISPQPYLFPALDAKEEDAINKFEHLLRAVTVRAFPI